MIFSRREFLSFAAASLRLSRLGLGCAEGDLYVNNRIGVSIVKPSHWHYISAVDYQSALPRQLLRDDTDDVLFELIKQGVTLPSLLMREKPAEDDSMCPYVGLWAEPLSVVLEEESDYSTEAPDLLAEALKAWGRTLDEFDVMVPPARTRHPVEGGARIIMRLAFSIQDLGWPVVEAPHAKSLGDSPALPVHGALRGARAGCQNRLGPNRVNAPYSASLSQPVRTSRPGLPGGWTRGLHTPPAD